jgi:hypothetical protein
MAEEASVFGDFSLHVNPFIILIVVFEPDYASMGNKVASV